MHRTPRATLFLALLAGLCWSGPGAQAAASRASHGEWIDLFHFQFQSCAPDHPYRRIQELSLELERREASKRTAYLTWELKQARSSGSRPKPVELPLTVHGCDDQNVSALSGGVGTFRCRGRSGELVVSHPRVRGCTLSARLSDGWADLITATGPGGRPHGPRPDPGGPDQGVYAARSLANLRIRAAHAAAGDPEKLAASIVNLGPGSSGTTRVKIFFHTAAGQVLTAQEPVPALSAGQQTAVHIGVGHPLAAAETVTLRVDDPNVVAETSELDNGYTFKK